MTLLKALGVGVALAAMSAVPAYAQEQGATPAAVDLTIVPGGGMFFLSGSTESHFRNYNVGGAVGVNLNNYIGLEGEGNMTMGVYHQNLVLSGTPVTEAPPNTVDFSGNVLFSIPGGQHSTVPYAAMGLGSLILLEHNDLAIPAAKMFFTANMGGGLKWYANNHWGLRADYRFVVIQSSDKAPEFFGREGRFAHRIYGGVILNLVE